MNSKTHTPLIPYWKQSILLVFFFHSLTQFADAQQLRINEVKGEYYGSRAYPRFDDRFKSSSNIQVDLDSPQFYQRKKIKRIEIFDHSSLNKIWMIEFDSSGKTIFKGIGSDRSYFFVYQQIFTQGKLSVQINRFYDKDTLVRVDSSFYSIKYFRYLDTMYQYTELLSKSYMRGSLLNKQNSYYNANYKREWYNKKFKTNYQTDSIYLSQINIQPHNLHHVRDSVLKYVDWARSEYVFSLHDINPKNLFLCSGASFEEPYNYYEPMGCPTGKYNYEKEREEMRTRGKYSLNGQGLRDSYYILVEHYSNKKEKYILYDIKYTYF